MKRALQLAGLLLAALLSVGLVAPYVAVDQYGNHTGRAIVQAVNGTLYEILPTGIQVLAVGQDLPDGVELRTARDTDAMLQLKDGSVVELGERAAFDRSVFYAGGVSGSFRQAAKL